MLPFYCSLEQTDPISPVSDPRSYGRNLLPTDKVLSDNVSFTAWLHEYLCLLLSNSPSPLFPRQEKGEITTNDLWLHIIPLHRQGSTSPCVSISAHSFLKLMVDLILLKLNRGHAIIRCSKLALLIHCHSSYLLFNQLSKISMKKTKQRNKEGGIHNTRRNHLNNQ